MSEELIKPTSAPPAKPEPVKGHPAIFADSCSICTHEFRAGVEELYLGYRSLAFIAEVAQVSQADLERHVIALKLDQKRADNTEDLTRHALNKSFDRGVMDTLDGDQTIRLLMWSEKRMGKVTERPDSRPPSVVIVGVPMIGRPSAKDEPVVISAVVQTGEAAPLMLPFASKKSSE